MKETGGWRHDSEPVERVYTSPHANPCALLQCICLLVIFQHSYNHKCLKLWWFFFFQWRFLAQNISSIQVIKTGDAGNLEISQNAWFKSVSLLKGNYRNIADCLLPSRYVANNCNIRTSCGVIIFLEWRSLPLGQGVNTLRPRRNGRHITDNIFKCFFQNKMYEFRLKFHWSLFLKVLLTIFQHWFRYGSAPTRRQTIIWTNGD